MGPWNFFFINNFWLCATNIPLFVAQKFKNFGGYQKWDAGIFIFLNNFFRLCATNMFRRANLCAINIPIFFVAQTSARPTIFFVAQSDTVFKTEITPPFSQCLSLLLPLLSLSLSPNPTISLTHSSHLISHLSLHYLSLSLTHSLISLSLSSLILSHSLLPLILIHSQSCQKVYSLQILNFFH